MRSILSYIVLLLSITTVASCLQETDVCTEAKLISKNLYKGKWEMDTFYISTNQGVKKYILNGAFTLEDSANSRDIVTITDDSANIYRLSFRRYCNSGNTGSPGEGMVTATINGLYYSNMGYAYTGISDDAKKAQILFSGYGFNGDSIFNKVRSFDLKLKR